MKTRLLIVGYGNMARAILKGFAKNASKLQDHHIQITGRDPEKIRPFLETLPLEVEIVPLRMRGEHYKEKVNPTDTPSYYNANIGGYAGWIEPALSVSAGYRLVADVNIEKAIVLLAIKPHALKNFTYQGTALLVLSVLAGVDIQALKECVKSHAYVRCMPNVAASYGLSATTYYVDSAYNPRYVGDRDLVEDEEWRYKWLFSQFPHDFLLEDVKPDSVHGYINRIVNLFAKNAVRPETYLEFEQQVLNHLQNDGKPNWDGQGISYTYGYGFDGVSCDVKLEELLAYVQNQPERFNKLVKKVYLSNFIRNQCTLIAKHQEHLKSQINPYVREILKCFGSCVEVQSEALIDASLATNGSSLAFLSMVAQGLMSAGVQEGLSVDQASELVEQSFKGFAKLLEEQSPQEIIDSICTPGGATIAGLSVLEEKAFKGILMQACHIAVRKGRTKFKSS
ncbi:pyrroline-5-carboxylate reductase dimerization domain-containing protein [Helicobacter felis]|uniref:pyrroline-5-carboxylate reductase dimerization domain-containing protein n=1 Tax=Helicobacter felis TaxID=214 RepID=UPI000CEF3FC6|nr:pyrroline-5-carboxylate reductase dimerization domain-containing protein [Helicobacter felis]